MVTVQETWLSAVDAEATWLAPYAAACIGAVEAALDLQDADEVIEHRDKHCYGEPGDGEPGSVRIVLTVFADPPRTVRVAWTLDQGQSYSPDAPRAHRSTTWRSVAVTNDCDPLDLAEALAGVEQAGSALKKRAS